MSEKASIVEQLREAADWLEARPELIEHFPDVYLFSTTFYDKAAFSKAAKVFGAANKSSDEWHYKLEKNLPSGAFLRLSGSRDSVCTRVKVGVKVIPAKPETVIPATEETVAEIYEWQCPDSILKPETATA